MKGMITCKVCGRDFPLIVEDHYIARDNKKTGIANAISSSEAILYDAFECPHCGCQNTMQARYRKLDASNECEDDIKEEVSDHDGCIGCAHEYLTCDEEPCSKCRYNHMDYYTPKEEESDE